MTHEKLLVAIAAFLCGCRAGNPAGSPRLDSLAVAAARPSVCARPARGVMVSVDTVAGFSTHATLGALRKLCAAGDSMMYDAGGWQAMSWMFPFAGARVVGGESSVSIDDTVRNDEVPDLWEVAGDSVRLPDDRLIPPTLGGLRLRYGVVLTDDNVGGDDMSGPIARVCRFPYLLFALAVQDTARHVANSARVTHVEMRGVDSVMARYCATHAADTT